MKPRKQYRHGKAERKMKCFRLPGELIEMLEKESNQTQIVVAALDKFYEGKKDV